MPHPGLDERVRDLLTAHDFAAAATEALRRLGPRVMRYLRSVLREEAAADEAFSQWSENLWKSLPAFGDRCSLHTWALRLAHNVALNQRDAGWHRRVRRFVTGEASRVAAEVRTTTAVRVERQRRALDTLLDALTPEERSLLTLRIDQELSWPEISQVVSGEGRFVSPDALMKRFERVKSRLAVLARERGLVDEAPRHERPTQDH